MEGFLSTGYRACTPGLFFIITSSDKRCRPPPIRRVFACSSSAHLQLDVIEEVGRISVGSRRNVAAAAAAAPPPPTTLSLHKHKLPPPAHHSSPPLHSHNTARTKADACQTKHKTRPLSLAVAETRLDVEVFVLTDGVERLPDCSIYTFC